MRILWSSLLIIPMGLQFGPQVCLAAEIETPNAIPTSIRTLDFRSLPGDAFDHSRTKWSGDFFILVDDDPGAPSLYMFDRSGRITTSAMIQITGASRVRVTDFAAASDGSIWTCGIGDSGTGQRSFFLAHVTNDGSSLQIIRTNPYRPSYLAVATDGTIWTVGYSLGSDGKVDLSLDSLRHFDPSGKLLASAIPANSVGILRVQEGLLNFNQGHLEWYSPSRGTQKLPDGNTVPEAYVEISPTDMTVLHSHPAMPRNHGDYVYGFAITPGGRVFAEMYRVNNTPTLYEFDRSIGNWVPAEGPRDQQGQISHLEGNDGESLVFSDHTDKSQLKLKILDLSQGLMR